MTLEAFLTDDPRGRHMPAYLAELSVHVDAQVRKVTAELDTTGALLDHLRQIVSAQQSVALFGGLLAPCNLEEILEDALRLQVRDQHHIEIRREYQALPPVVTDRHKLVQIVANLLSNARDALNASGSGGLLRLSLFREEDDAVIDIEDSGVGMSAEVLATLWRFGFTTKPGGHGFGLHYCAKAAREIGAIITAQSKGRGHGSRFIIRLPMIRQAPLERTAESRTASPGQANEQPGEQMRLHQPAADELGLAQKLESVGRLAAGIAHELNTPIQYISDSMHFLKSAFGELAAALGPAPKGPDLAFVCEEVPLAIERVLEGTEYVVGIVRAMKEFAHPDGGEKTPADLNRALQTTLLIARNEYKYVAVAELQAGEIPEVMCNVGELSQVFLNLIVNSAHALADAGRDSETGRITIRTSLEGEWVLITFTDNGCGIPPSIMQKIFDPFFTTKEAGRGTGQGLAIARSIIVDKHGGRIEVGSEPGRGTCFTVRLPVEAVPAAARSGAPGF